MSSYFKIIYAGLTDTGIVRNENQDSMGIFPSEKNLAEMQKGQIFIVADGMGGHQKGKIVYKKGFDLLSKMQIFNYFISLKAI